MATDAAGAAGCLDDVRSLADRYHLSSDPPTAPADKALGSVRPGDLARSGGGWRMLPKDFPPWWPTVYRWFRRFVRRFMFRTIHDVALMLDRERAGREG